jgi:hypothetical protein
VIDGKGKTGRKVGVGLDFCRPYPRHGGGWTKIGSPEWLDELFPNWNEPTEDGAP